MKTIVAERGRVTIPKALRDKLGIRPGTVLQFGVKEGSLVACKADTDPMASVFGCLGRGIDSEEFVRTIRRGPKR